MLKGRDKAILVYKANLFSPADNESVTYIETLHLEPEKVPDSLYLGNLGLQELSCLADLHTDDKLCDLVIKCLRRHAPVYLLRDICDKGLEASSMPPTLRETIERLYSKLSRLGILLIKSEEKPCLPKKAPISNPELEILSSLLSQKEEAEHKCILEPSTLCTNSSRCRMRGF